MNLITWFCVIQTKFFSYSNQFLTLLVTRIKPKIYQDWFCKNISKIHSKYFEYFTNRHDMNVNRYNKLDSHWLLMRRVHHVSNLI